MRLLGCTFILPVLAVIAILVIVHFLLMLLLELATSMYCTPSIDSLAHLVNFDLSKQRQIGFYAYNVDRVVFAANWHVTACVGACLIVFKSDR
jgi:hypothetical protein